MAAVSPQELRARREALGLSQTDLASYLGVSYWTLRNWESGRRAPRGAALHHLRYALGLADAAQATGSPLPDWRKQFTQGYRAQLEKEGIHLVEP